MFDIMPITPSWTDIALRLLLTVIAGSVIGINREAGGHAAGLRTTVLVGLAACLAMVQANLMLPVAGKTDHSFAVMDTLRLPLGILTGVGFIGGGAILKRGDLVTGVTTAATLWIMTAVGLCFGGGQLIVGCTGALIALIVLSPLKALDDLLPRKQKARLVLSTVSRTAAEIEAMLSGLSVKARFVSRQKSSTAEVNVSTFELIWTGGRKVTAEMILSSLERGLEIDTFEVLGLEA